MNHFIKNKTSPSERGIALITVMLMMAVMTVLSITMFNTSTVESLISSNYRTSKEAFFDADAGVQYALAKINEDLENHDIDDIDPADYSPPSGFRFELSSLTQSGNTYYFTSTGDGSNNARAVIKAHFEVEERIDPAFGVGIVSEGDIRINGAPTINGSIHANGNIVQNGEGAISGNISAVGNLDIDSAVNGSQTPGAAYMDLPKITQQFLDDKRAEVQTNQQIEPDKYEYYAGNQTIRNDVQDKVIFVDGNVTISNNTKVSSNTTIIATGNITFRGESSFAEGAGPDDPGFEIKTAIIAGGDITFNGSGNSYGVFWCNGDFTRNGSSYAHGSIVAAGGVEDPDIVFNGVFEFSHFDAINNDFVPTRVTADFSSWSDQSLL